MTQAARYRHRIAIQERVESQDSETGDITSVWASLSIGSSSSSQELDDVPAEVLTGPGREFQAANAKQSETDVRVNMHWFHGLTTAHRVVWQDQPYDITSIETDATGRREYRLRCKAGVNDGG